MLRPSPSCWLFLDCRVMTGVAPYKCPNKTACKRNAQHSKNRSCSVPYRRYKSAYKDDIEGLHVAQSWDIPEEAKPYGWAAAVNLPYEYDGKANILWIGRPAFYGLLFHVPEEAEALGFARSIDIPYYLSDTEKAWLVVIRHAIMRDYPQYLKDGGWYPAVEIPYIMCFDFWNAETKKFELENVMKVWFNPDDPEYEGALAQGWYPAEDL